ncbi:MAG: 2OG-Fe(II) oxygenase [Bacteroidota bacterium]
MQDITKNLDKLDWHHIEEQMHESGYAHVPRFISGGQSDQLVNMYDQSHLYRKTIAMERYRFGLGEYRYFTYPLPEVIDTLRKGMYPGLSRIANRWMEALKSTDRFPDTMEELQELCRLKGQTKATPLVLKYGEKGHNTLHQDLYGEIFFPIQAVLFLSEPDEDFEGGEFVMTEQRPRAQSKVIVRRPRKGDLMVFTTHSRPVLGNRGYYRVNMKHGVSEVLSGQRYTLGIIFHDAKN